VCADFTQALGEFRMRNIDGTGNVTHAEFTGGSDINEQHVVLALHPLP
jgi:hypothetical protein